MTLGSTEKKKKKKVAIKSFMPQISVEHLQCARCSRYWENTGEETDKSPAFKNLHSRREQSVKQRHWPWVREGRVAISCASEDLRSLCHTIELPVSTSAPLGRNALLPYPQGLALVLIRMSYGHPKRHMGHRLDVVNGCLGGHACLGDSKSEERTGSLSVPHTLGH